MDSLDATTGASGNRNWCCTRPEVPHAACSERSTAIGAEIPQASATAGAPARGGDRRTVLTGILIGLLLAVVVSTADVAIGVFLLDAVDPTESLTHRVSDHLVRSGAVTLGVAVGVAIISIALVRKRRLAEDAVQRERDFLQMVIDGAPDPLMVIGLDYRVILMNKAARGYLDNDSDAAGPLLCHRVSHKSEVPCSGTEHPCPLGEVQRTLKPVKVVHEHIMSEGERRIFELEATPLWNQDGELVGIIEGSRDITERARAERQLRENRAHLHYLAHHDPLTHLPNRLLFQDRLQQAIHRAQRRSLHLAVLFLDLDRFKNINDELGHSVGDDLLKVVGQRLRNVTRKGDTVARLGGDEFVIVLDSIEGARGAALVAQKLLEDLSRPVTLGHHEIRPGTSVGIAVYPEDAVDVEGLMKCADIAMYRAKQRGGSGYQFYTADMTARAAGLFKLENDLRGAMASDQLLLHFQPQLNLHTHRLSGVEALVRWRHPRLGMLSAAEFLPLAEERGMSVLLGTWVMQAACEQNKRWQEAGHAPVRMCVNLSARQLHRGDLVDSVARVLRETSLDPQYLELEVAECCAMDDAEAKLETLNSLRRTGVSLAIDDFGTGYSSVRYLKRFPIRRVKIDRSFVQDVTRDPNNAAIAASTIALAKTLQLDVIAEGVETEEQSVFLRQHGCDHGQGFLYGRPMPASDFERFFGAGGAGRSTLAS